MPRPSNDADIIKSTRASGLLRGERRKSVNMVRVQDSGESLRHRIRAIAPNSVALSEQVYESLGDAIVEGRLEPGEHLSDKELAAALGVSRTPVREALQRLALAGLVEFSPNRFTRVTHVSDEIVAQTLEYTGLQAGVALQLALRRMDDQELAAATALLDRMIEASDRDDAGDLMRAARLFVGYLTQKSGNAVLGRAMHEASLMLERNLRQALPQLQTRAFRGECYRQMRLAMQERDADAAEHWFRVQHGIEASTPPASHS